MKIADNRLSSVWPYFKEKLESNYALQEVRKMYQLSMEHLFGLQPHELVLHGNKRISESEFLKIRSVVKGLEREEPLQYLLGKSWFYGLELNVNKHVLIPRQETEELVQWVVDSVEGLKLSSPGILDIGTGSGCIALALKSRFPHAVVRGVDVSEQALDVAQENATRLGLTIHYELVDILQSNELPGETLDFVVSNPPYVTRVEAGLMRKNVMDYEPHLALFVPDDDPFVFHRHIASIALNKLNRGGMLFFEINEYLGEELCEVLRSMQFKAVELRKDLNNKQRFIRCIVP